MTQKQLDTLIMMANQISTNNEHYGPEDAAHRVAKHLTAFWARSMKKMIISYLVENGSALNPIAKQGVKLLSEAYPEMTPT